MALCKEHKALAEDIAVIKTDIALIKQSLLGNEGRNDGLVDKVNKHDVYFYMIAGGASLVSTAWAVFTVIK